MDTDLHSVRYAHINGAHSTVSEDAVRPGMRRIEEMAGFEWLSTQIPDCISSVLGILSILDIDIPWTVYPTPCPDTGPLVWRKMAR